MKLYEPVCVFVFVCVALCGACAVTIGLSFENGRCVDPQFGLDDIA